MGIVAAHTHSHVLLWHPTASSLQPVWHWHTQLSGLHDLHMPLRGGQTHGNFSHASHFNTHVHKLGWHLSHVSICMHVHLSHGCGIHKHALLLHSHTIWQAHAHSDTSAEDGMMTLLHELTPLTEPSTDCERDRRLLSLLPLARGEGCRADGSDSALSVQEGE